MSHPLRITVIVRVFDRLDDLHICLDVLRRHWTNAEYHVIVVSNGKADGFTVPPATAALAGRVIELERNAGHLRGNAQLLQEGIRHLPADSEFTVILEADTWIFSDAIVLRYCEHMRRKNAVWASAEWIEKNHSLALDFALIDSRWLSANPGVFDFSVHAEAFVCNYLRRTRAAYLFVEECMPVHVPRAVRWLYNPFHGRMRCFTAARMVTHHVEDLPDGMEGKQTQANITLNRREFPVRPEIRLAAEHRKLRMIEFLVKIAPRSRWLKAKRERSL